jgi:hypothetical protein
MIVVQIVVEWSAIKQTLFAPGLGLNGQSGGGGVGIIPIPPVGPLNPKNGSEDEPPIDEEPPVFDIPVLAAHYTPATKG